MAVLSASSGEHGVSPSRNDDVLVEGMEDGSIRLSRPLFPVGELLDGGKVGPCLGHGPLHDLVGSLLRQQGLDEPSNQEDVFMDHVGPFGPGTTVGAARGVERSPYPFAGGPAGGRRRPVVGVLFGFGGAKGLVGFDPATIVDIRVVFHRSNLSARGGLTGVGSGASKRRWFFT